MVKLLLKVRRGRFILGSSTWGKKLKFGVKSITMKTVLFSLIYIIKSSVHMHVLVNTHASAQTHLHTTDDIV